MSYESGAYDQPNTDGFGPDPVVVLVIKGTHDVSRFVNLLNGASPNIEQLQLGQRVASQVRRDRAGRAALQLLADHGGPDLLHPKVEGLDEDRLAVVRRLAAGMTVQQIAREMHVSQSGISMRIARACRAVGARSREQLVALCTRLDLANPGPLNGGSPRDGGS